MKCQIMLKVNPLCIILNFYFFFKEDFDICGRFNSLSIFKNISCGSVDQKVLILRGF